MGASGATLVLLPALLGCCALGTACARVPVAGETDTQGAAVTTVTPDAPEATAHAGVDSDTVRWIQARLNELGYDAGPVDGKPGPATRRAIEAYQQDQGLERDGRATARLRDYLWRNGG